MANKKTTKTTKSTLSNKAKKDIAKDKNTQRFTGYDFHVIKPGDKKKK